MNTASAFRLRAAAACLSLAGLAAPALAHTTWILPNATVFEGKEPVASVDAAVSEDLFSFERGLKLQTVQITGPDGKARSDQNRSSARHRESFDVALDVDGTYRISHLSENVMATYKDPASGETKRFRGTPEAFAKAVPAQAEVTGMMVTLNRLQTFVSKEVPEPHRFSAEGKGLEVLPLGAVTDLSAGDRTRLQLLFNGQPLPGASLKLLREGGRYRYKLGDLALSSDAQGVVEITWPEAGRYYLSASHGDQPPAPPAPSASAGGMPPPPALGGSRAKPMQRAMVGVTFEVLPK